MKDYLSVKEFSRLSGIEQTTLRYWDNIGLFSPAKRDPENNYRYYSPQQVIAVNFITVLSELGIPLKTIGKREKDRSPEKMVELIEQQGKRLDMEMRRLRECYSIIHTRLEMINYGRRLSEGFNMLNGVRLEDDFLPDNVIHVDENYVGVLYREEKSIILGPRNEVAKGESFYDSFMKFCTSASELRLNLSFPIGGYHDNYISFFKSDPTVPDYFFSLDPTGNRRLESGNYLTGFTRGDYGDFGDLPRRMESYAAEQKLSMSGPLYTLYLHDEICVKDPDKYLVQVCVKVK